MFREIAFIIGFPSLYGGAGAELYHQLRVWEILGVEIHFIPTRDASSENPLYPEMLSRGFTVHAPWRDTDWVQDTNGRSRWLGTA